MLTHGGSGTRNPSVPPCVAADWVVFLGSAEAVCKNEATGFVVETMASAQRACWSSRSRVTVRSN